MSADLEDARRTQPVSIKWTNDGAGIGRLYIGDEFWGAIEWSEKRRAWCIEDAAGECLTHAASIRGKSVIKSTAVTLARKMIRDGRMPTPEQAKAEHKARQAAQAERRARQPAVIARKAAQAVERAKDEARWKLESAERAAPPLWAAMSDVFDFSDPELWRSNSFAVLRPRLVVHMKAIVADIEHRRGWCLKYPQQLAKLDAELDRARAALAAMEAAG